MKFAARLYKSTLRTIRLMSFYDRIVRRSVLQQKGKKSSAKQKFNLDTNFQVCFQVPNNCLCSALAKRSGPKALAFSGQQP